MILINLFIIIIICFYFINQNIVVIFIVFYCLVYLFIHEYLINHMMSINILVYIFVVSFNYISIMIKDKIYYFDLILTIINIILQLIINILSIYVIFGFIIN